MSYRQTGDEKVTAKIGALEKYVETKVPSFEMPKGKMGYNWFMTTWNEPEKGFYKISKNLRSAKKDGHLRPAIQKAIDDAEATRQAVKRVGKKSISKEEKDLRLENDDLKRKLRSLGQSVYDLLQENKQLRETLGVEQSRFIDRATVTEFGGTDG